MAGLAALGLVVTLFLPWYQETVIPTGVGIKAALPSASLTGWAAFSFVEAAVLLISVGVLVLLFVRAEGGAFHVPGGDGGVITAAGLWTCLLIIWRMFDKQSTARSAQFVTTSGIEWGLFIALGVAALLAYAGSRIKLAHEPEPPLPGDRPLPRRSPTPSPAGGPQRPREGRTQPLSGPRTEPLPALPAEARTHPLPPSPDEAHTQPLPPAPDEAQTQTRLEPPSAGPGTDDEAEPPRRRTGRRPHRGLDFSELDEIEFDAPPEAPVVRRRTPDPATRLDRPQ